MRGAKPLVMVLPIGIEDQFTGVVDLLTMKAFVDSVKSTMRTMGYLGLLLSAAALFGFVFNYHRVPQQFTEAFLTLELSPFLILAFVIYQLLLLIRGTRSVNMIIALVALLVLYGIWRGTAVYFEAAMLIAMVGFVSTVAYCRYLLRGDIIE